MVRKDRIDQPDQQVFVVKPLKETAGYVARTPGGVRGGGREAPLYSIGGGGRKPELTVLLFMVEAGDFEKNVRLRHQTMT